MECKNGAEHLQSLRDGRTVYLDGKLVDDVTTYPAYCNAVATAGLLYDYQSRPENTELMTFQPEGGARRVNRCWQMPRSYEELVQRRKALQAWAHLSHGFLGRSPDHVASAVIGQRMGLDVFAKHGAARAQVLADYVDYATRNDLFLTYVIVNPQADRSKDWGEQRARRHGADTARVGTHRANATRSCATASRSPRPGHSRWSSRGLPRASRAS
jgi:4-hydroxyphenylacetate 3-monooxygenase